MQYVMKSAFTKKMIVSATKERHHNKTEHSLENHQLLEHKKRFQLRQGLLMRLSHHGTGKAK
jgi:hypothetical protein